MGKIVNVRASTTVIDRGWNKLFVNIKLLDKGHVDVGVQQGAEHKPSNKGSRPTKSSDLVKIAAIQEFGAPKRKIPVRSFIRSTADNRRTEVAKQKTALAKAVIDGRITPRRAFGILGLSHKADVQDTIVRLRTPGNTLVTQKRKRGVDNPLIDTGQLRQSIRHVIGGI